MSDSLQPHGLQHTRPPWPSPAPEAYSNLCPLSRWCHRAISSSVVPFSSCLHSFPASGSVSYNRHVWVVQPSDLNTFQRLHVQTSSHWALCVHEPSSHVWLFATPWTAAHQAPLSVEFSRQEYWSGCHFLLRRLFLIQGSNPRFLHLLH